MAKFTDRYGGYCTCTREKCSDECSAYRRYKPIPTTNADRLRQMSDEELAGWAAERSTAPNCTGKCHKDYEVYGELRTFCHDCWLDWLKQEADNETTD